MSKVVIDMSMSLDGFVAGPDDGRKHPLGRQGGKPPASYPRGPSNLTFVRDGIASAISQARAVAGGKDIKLGGTSPGKQALAAGRCDEILIHIAPYLLGAGVRLFDALPDGMPLEMLSVSDGPFATHMRYRVLAKHA